MDELMQYLRQAEADGASDLFIVAGGPVSEKVSGRLQAMNPGKVMPDDTRQLVEAMYALAGRAMPQPLLDDDFSFSVPGLARFRANVYRQRGSLAAVIRVVAFHIPDWEALHIPPQVMELSALRHGMVLVTGSADSGKSTTLACLIDRINRTRQAHIITLEDPIEYLHRDQQCIISQREIATDTADHLSALRACLRQAPDVILLGEMRDAETIRTAMTAAETGHLLFATLHTRGGREHHRPDHRLLPPGPADPDPGPAEHGAVYRGLPAAGTRRCRGAGACGGDPADDPRHPQHDPGQQEPPDRRSHRRRGRRRDVQHGPVPGGAVPAGRHHPGDRPGARRQPGPAGPPTLNPTSSLRDSAKNSAVSFYFSAQKSHLAIFTILPWKVCAIFLKILKEKTPDVTVDVTAGCYTELTDPTQPIHKDHRSRDRPLLF